MSVPAWVKDAVFYQIFPDRFANGDSSLDPPNVQPWGTPPTARGFQGGDLKGIIDHFDYLLDLGINAIYLNPIFMAASTHRYDTIDYLRIDPKLGALDDFHALIQTAHRNEVRVILDGVFNHCARGFFAFNDILENEADSPYLDWFHVKKFPLRAYERGRAKNYVAWWGFKSLPKFNTDYPPVRRYLLDIARYWIEQGADGWRLDVPNEIDDDNFWAEFRRTVHAANPEAYILGEIWDGNPRWVGENHFDGLMNYPVRTAVLDTLSGRITPSRLFDTLAGGLALYAPENALAMYNLVGSHDTERIITLLDGDGRKAGLAHFLAFTFPGAPAIYYGDEVGLPGGRDPDCRRAFPWNQQAWDTPLRTWIKTLVKMRKDVPALRRGGFQALVAQDSPACFAFARTLEGQPAVAAVNANDAPVNLEIPVQEIGLVDGQQLRGVIDGSEMVVRDGKIQVLLEAWHGLAWA